MRIDRFIFNINKIVSKFAFKVYFDKYPFGNFCPITNKTERAYDICFYSLNKYVQFTLTVYYPLNKCCITLSESKRYKYHPFKSTKAFFIYFEKNFRRLCKSYY